jgi:hypothetical protein
MKPLVRNNKGQFVIETVLLMFVTVSLFIWATGELRDRKILAKFIGEPWVKISGMIETGVWQEPSQARTSHPNQLKRSLSLDPKEL